MMFLTEKVQTVPLEFYKKILSEKELFASFLEIFQKVGSEYSILKFFRKFFKGIFNHLEELNQKNLIIFLEKGI